MLFDRLFRKPRRAAETPADPETLLGIARTHGDSGARADAVRRLESLPHLRELLSAQGASALNGDAFARYRALLAGTDPTPPPLTERLAECEAVTDDGLLEHLARYAREPELRRVALERVAAPALLIDCALHDPVAANRAAAAARIAERADLERLAREIARKDKAVYRAVRERLRLIAEQEAQPQRIAALCADLCERVERLGHLSQWTQDRALLEHLDRQWAEVAAQAEPAWQDRYTAGRERFLGAHGAYQASAASQVAAEETRRGLHARREDLIAEAATLLDLDTEAALRAALARVTADWSQLEPLTDPGQRDCERRFRQHLQAAETRAQGLADQRQRSGQLRQAQAQAQSLLNESKPLDLARTRTLIERGRTLAGALASGQDPDPAAIASFADLAERLEARLKTQRRHAEQRLADLPARVDALQALVEAGELKQADPIHQSLQATLDLIHQSGLPRSATADLEARLRTLGPRVRDLQHWRRWGANQHRQALCEAMETLHGEDLPLAAVAERLHVLKTDWQEVDRAGSPANRALWERFHRAATAVGERVRPVIEAQAAEQEANRVAREQVCQQLDEFLKQVDWERVDWKRVMHAAREVRQAWGGIGPCEPRARRRLDRRYHQAIRTLDQRLEEERARNQAAKRALIARVQALAETPGLDAAIEEAKAIQRQWHTTVPARQRDENRLWQSFRAACDVVFERRAVQHQAQRGEAEANLAARTALCEEVLAFAAAQTDPQRLTAGLRDFDQRWRDAEAGPIPRQAMGPLNRRWHQARERLLERREELETAERYALLDLLAERAGLCQTLEQGLLDGTGDDDPGALLTVQDTWSRLPALPERGLQEAFERRLGAAREAAGHPERLPDYRTLAGRHAEARRRLCLEIEIAAGVESPAAQAQERLRVQVDRLAERLSEGEPEARRDLGALLRTWYLTGPAPRDEALEARVDRVRQTLSQR